MSNRTNFLGVEIPYIVGSRCSPIDIKCFPNPCSPIASFVKMCDSKLRIPYDDAMVSNFQQRHSFWNTLDTVRVESLAWADKNGFGLTKQGKNLVKIINWFAPIYELLEFVSESGISNADELDIQLSIAGKHSLVCRDVVERVRIVFCYKVNTLGRDVHYWVSEFLRAICREIEMSYDKIFRELFKRLDSNALAA